VRRSPAQRVASERLSSGLFRTIRMVIVFLSFAERLLLKTLTA
jgi:hypothetical protein